MRCRLPSTRLLRSETAYSRSTTSGPGTCRRSLAIFGFLKLSRNSALSPSSFTIDVIIYPVFVFSLIAKGNAAWTGAGAFWRRANGTKQRRMDSTPIQAPRHFHLQVHVLYSFCFWNVLWPV